MYLKFIWRLLSPREQWGVITVLMLALGWIIWRNGH